MTGHLPPYLLEFRAARAVIASGSTKAGKLDTMLKSQSAFFFDGDRKDFESDSACAAMLQAHNNCFLKNLVDDMVFRSDLTEKLLTKGNLKKARLLIAEPGIKLLSIAARENMTCIYTGGFPLWDMSIACAEAAIPAVEVQAFIQSL